MCPCLRVLLRRALCLLLRAGSKSETYCSDCWPGQEKSRLGAAARTWSFSASYLGRVFLHRVLGASQGRLRLLPVHCFLDCLRFWLRLRLARALVLSGRIMGPAGAEMSKKQTKRVSPLPSCVLGLLYSARLALSPIPQLYAGELSGSSAEALLSLGSPGEYRHFARSSMPSERAHSSLAILTCSAAEGLRAG